MQKEGATLQRIRAEQMIGIVVEGKMETFVSELAQLVVIKIMVFSARRFEFEFMDGSRITV